MDLLTLILFAVGVVLLLVGAEALVRGAARLAVTFGISPLVVGLTVVAFGTSAPELAVNVSSAAQGQSDIGVGNIVGSNVFNILFILGLAATIAPLVVSQQVVRLEVPLMIAVSVVFLLFALNGNVSTLEGAILFAGIVVYTVWVIRKSRREGKAVQEEYEKEFSGYDQTPIAMAKDLGLVVGGLGLLVLGSHWFVEGAVEMAEFFGVSELVIGLTVVAMGTSMPEVATSVVASIRGERDIAVGNVVGSNLFNILMVLGLTSFIAKGGIDVPDAALRFDIPVMIVVAVACLPVFVTGKEIARWEGVVFLLYAVAYVTYLLLDASGNEATRAFAVAMVGFAMPLTAITLVVLLVRHVRNGDPPAAADSG